MDYGILYIGDNLKLKQLNDGFVCFLQTHRFSIHKMLIDGLESCGLLWCFYLLQRIHWWASDAMLHFSKSVTMKKQTHRHVGFSANSNFEDKYVKIKAHTHLLAGLMSQCSDSLSSVKPAFSRRDLHSSTTARQRRMEEKDIQKKVTLDIQSVNLHTIKLMHVPVQCLHHSDITKPVI